MLEAGLEALQMLADPVRLAWLLAGVGVGVAVGLLPGLGAVTAMTVLLPLVFGMDPYTGMALLIGMMTVTTTSDTFMSVLIGVPGGSASQATIMDGYPMARRGEAGRALSAAFLASMIGGLLGAGFLLAAIPIARPLVLALRSPHLFMLTLLGLSLVAVISKGAPLKGLVAGLLGMLMASMGLPPAASAIRFDFGIAYLSDGLSLIVVALGLFAIPEVIELIVENRSISRSAKTVEGGRRQGARDVWQNKGLVVGNAGAGVFLGMVPGIGGAVIDWITYGAAKQYVRNNRFGEGDVRGVIAPEAATSSKEGGTLLPTLLFGIPGGALTAILLGGLVLLGVEPGPSMLEPRNLPLLMTIVWTTALASIFGAAVCFGLSKPVSKLTGIPTRRFAPIIVAIVLMSAFQASRSWGDLIAILVIGAIAYVMKLAGWPRPPLLIGFVLGTSAERYLTIAISLEGARWLLRPGVIAIGVVCIAAIVGGLWRGGTKIEEIEQEGLQDVSKVAEVGSAASDTDRGGESR